MTGRDHHSIREVLDLLVEEFPDVTISKIRFLESRGLIHPERTPSGYRKFYDADVERLRWILRQQRENFLPLKVIKGRLEQGNDAEDTTIPATLFETAPDDPDDGSLLAGVAAFAAVERGTTATLEVTRVAAPARTMEHIERLSPALEELPVVAAATMMADGPAEDETSKPAARARRSAHPAAGPPGAGRRRSETPTGGGGDGGGTTPPRGGRSAVRAASAELIGASLTAEELAHTLEVDVAEVAELREYGLIEARTIAGVPCYDEEALLIARLACAFRRFGIEPRHLRAFKHAAEREASLFAQVVTPLLRQRNPEARALAHSQLDELAELGRSLSERFVRAELHDITGG